MVDKRADREAKEGLILTRISDDAKKAVAIEINWETDFVARNEDSSSTAEAFLNAAYDHETSSVDTLLTVEMAGEPLLIIARHDG